ncbi:hypothetical protein [Larkinella humicola]|uniref:Uncharacterized protein n=1 Tax=Larkinella humicola TaxID=2607654 RepID=A0A5N1JMW6_9BACT|nr:hypothetical protein [Larkinella humicola]KAA9355273.1 hypothetical protein F0P93_11900 [Larkinella humicola]
MSDESLDQTVPDSSHESRTLRLQGFATIDHDTVNRLVKVKLFDGEESNYHDFTIPYADILEKEIFSCKIGGQAVSFLNLVVTYTEERFSTLTGYIPAGMAPVQPFILPAPGISAAARDSKVPPGAPPKQFTAISLDLNHFEAGNLARVESGRRMS